MTTPVPNVGPDECNLCGAMPGACDCVLMEPEDFAEKILETMDTLADEHYEAMKSQPMNCMGYGSAMHDLRHVIGDMFPNLKQ